MCRRMSGVPVPGKGEMRRWERFLEQPCTCPVNPGARVREPLPPILFGRGGRGWTGRGKRTLGSGEAPMREVAFASRGYEYHRSLRKPRQSPDTRALLGSSALLRTCKNSPPIESLARTASFHQKGGSSASTPPSNVRCTRRPASP